MSEPFSGADFDKYTPDLQMGERLFNAAACGACHQTKDQAYIAAQPALGGGLEIDNLTYGLIRVPNISPDKTNGIGAWSRAQFLNAMIYGISPKGGDYIPVHPYEFYAGLKPEHAVDIFEYIKAEVTAVTRSNSPNRLKRRLFGTINPLRYSFDPDAIIKARAQKGLGEDPSDSAAWGEYLVEHVSACGSCHTARNGSFNQLQNGDFRATHSALGRQELIGLEVPQDGSITSLIPARNEFEHIFINQGLRLDGRAPMQGSMKRVVDGLALLPASDKVAIHQYLKGLLAPEPYEVKVSCDAPAAPVQVTGRDGEDLTKSVDVWLQKQCKSCHIRGASAAQKALLARSERVATDSGLIAAGRPEQSLLFQSISGTKGVAQMPPGNTVSDADIEVVRQWIEALQINAQTVAPIDAALERHATRKHITQPEIMKAVQRHIQSVDVADQKNMRYFSFQSYFNGHLPCQEEEAFVRQHLTPHLAALSKLLNSLSWKHDLVKAKPLEGAPYVFAVDISDLEWSAAQWDVLVSGEIPGLATPEPYPYGGNPTGINADPALQVIAALSQTNTPIMRADWFVGHGGQPLYYKHLLGLPDHVDQLENRLRVNLNDAIATTDDVIRLGFLEGSSGVSVNNRLLDRIDLPSGGYYWLSYDFDRPVKADSQRRLKDFPLGPKAALPHLETFAHDGGEMLFSLPNGLQGYYLTDKAGNYLEKGPVSVVFHPVQAGYLSPVFGPEIANGAGCMACHINGIISASDQIKEAIITEGLLPNSKSAQRLFETLYAGDEVVREKMEGDIAYYLKALAEIDGNPGLKTADLQGAGVFHEEPVTNLMSVYFEPIDREKLAAEFGFTFRELQDRAKVLPNAARAKNILSSWFVALESRGVIERSDVERHFQQVYAALFDTEPKSETPGSYAAASDPETITVASGVAYSPRHGLKVTPIKRQIRVCERAQIAVETDKACHLQVVFPDESSGKLVLTELPAEMLGGRHLQPGEKRIIPQFCEDCPQLVANEPSAGWEIYVNCFTDGAPPTDMVQQQQAATAKTVYQSASVMFANATESVSKTQDISSPISVTARFITFENPDAKFDANGQCLKVE